MIPGPTQDFGMKGGITDFVSCLFIGVLDIPMISWVVMLVSRLLDYVATVEDEAAASKKPLNGKERERFLSGICY